MNVQPVRGTYTHSRLGGSPDAQPRASAQTVDTAETSAEALAADRVFRADLARIIPSLRSFARGLCGKTDMADDIAQEAMMRGWAARASFTPGTNFKAWMFTIARNQFYTSIRKNKMFVSWDPEWAGNELVQAPAQEGVIHLADVARALGKLPAEQREVLLLVGANGMPYEEAAEVIGCAIGTIKSRLARGRRALALLIAGPEIQDVFDKAA